MDKRRLAYTLLLVGVTFVALLHTALAYAFDTGLEGIGVLVAGLGVLGVLFVNFGMPAPAGGPDTGSSTDPGTDDAETGSD